MIAQIRNDSMMMDSSKDQLPLAVLTDEEVRELQNRSDMEQVDES